jgi:hypothetical protein
MFGTNSDGNYWDACKKGFAIWERETAKYLDTVIRSPALLTPAGQAMTSAAKMRAKMSDSLTQTWGGMGLPTKHDQERTLHALNQIQSRLIDIEDRLQAQEDRQAAQAAARAPVEATGSKPTTAKKPRASRAKAKPAAATAE